MDFDDAINYLEFFFKNVCLLVLALVLLLFYPTLVNYLNGDLSISNGECGIVHFGFDLFIFFELQDGSYEEVNIGYVVDRDPKYFIDFDIYLYFIILNLYLTKNNRIII